MYALLTQASQAMIQNDAATLEDLCVQASSVASPTAPLSERERAALASAMIGFQRQVLAARSNLTVRRRLLDNAREASPWGR